MKILSISTALSATLLGTLVQFAVADLSKIIRVDQSSQQFIDAQGRSRFFHGTNMVKKSPPWHMDVVNFVPSWSIVDEDIALMKSLNINIIRLGVHWAGVEPVRGQYNQTYLDITYGIIQKLQDNNIYTLVDQHQDVLAGQFCGHGVPDWFVQPGWVEASHMFPYPQKAPFAVNASGMPAASDCSSIDWSTSYLDYGTANAFGRLYNNYDNLGDAWAAYWTTVSTNYNMLPGVMGYDLMNEPWVGDSMANPTLLIPGVADHVNLEPLWNKGNAAIRAVDNTTIVFFEGSTYDILSGFNNVPGNDGSKTAQSYHYYKPPQLGAISTTIQNRIQDATRLQTTGMLTEFQFWDNSPASVALILEGAQQADIYLQSWQGWAYENLWNHDPVEPYAELARVYARTYAEATAGETLTLYFQDTTAKYWVSWKANTAITAPGLIRIAPQIYYPDGIRVFFVPAGSGSYTMDGNNTVQLFYTSAAQNGETIQASVQPFFPTDIVKNPASGKCMDNGNANVTANNQILLWTCSSAANQVWKFKNNTIQLAFDPNHNSGTYCLDTNNTAVVLNACQTGKPSQQWSVSQTGNILNTATGKCVDITGSNYNDGTALMIYPCGAGGSQGNQVWTLPRGANGSW